MPARLGYYYDLAFSTLVQQRIHILYIWPYLKVAQAFVWWVLPCFVFPSGSMDVEIVCVTGSRMRLQASAMCRY